MDRPSQQSPLREARQRSGLTLVQLAAKAGCSPSTVSAAEAGYLPEKLLHRLAKALNVSSRSLRQRVASGGPEAA